MPSYKHQALIELFRNCPELAAKLLRDVLRVAVPAYCEARVESADVTDLKTAERQADLVVRFRNEETVLAAAVEVQLWRDAKKRRRWPSYAIGLSDRFECPACVLVITVDEKTARWCREPIEIGPGNVFVPLVIGPERVPVVTSVTEAERDPELAILSALAHGKGPHAEQVGHAALRSTLRLPADQQLVYCDLILAALTDAARTALENLMRSRYEYQSDFAKKYFSEGRAEGEAKGRAEGEAKALLAVLQARGVPVSDEARGRILACTDAAQLDAWVRKAVAVASADELF